MVEEHYSIPVLLRIAEWSYLLPVIAGWTRWKFLSQGIRVLVIMFTSSLPFIAGVDYLSGHYVNTVWISEVYSQIEFVVFGLVFASWSREAKANAFSKAIVIFSLVVWVAAKLNFEGLTATGTFTDCLRDLSLAIIAVTVLILLISQETPRMFGDPRFWFVSGALFYNFATLPFFALANQFLPYSVSDLAKVWSINWIATILVNTIYVVAFIVSRGDSRIEKTITQKVFASTIGY